MTDRLIKNENHDWIDTETNEIVDMDEAFDLINESHTEIMNLLADLTKFKLVMIEIIEDLEKGEGNEKYVEWIKENVNITF